MSEKRSFLTTEWRYLLMLNYEIKASVLEPLLPAGTELDTWQGRTLVSMVGLMFQRTRVMGLPIPFHRNFEEVNLRFYVKRETQDEVKRGVVFIKELVPKVWVARMARWLYGENYAALPMRHTIEEQNGQLASDGLVEYAWRFKGKLQRLGGLGIGQPRPLQPDSEEAFITEHYWGYTRRGKHNTDEYRVEHPAWRTWRVAQPYFLADVKALYGPQFVDALHRPPRSAFLAEGSPVAVCWGEKLKV